MARIRTIKPEFWRHAVMAQLPAEAQLLALALLNMADDHGYFEADPRIVRGEVMPFREDLATVSRDLRELSRSGWVEVKNTPGHGAVGRIVNWTKHQRVTHPTESKLKVYFDTCEAIQVLTRSDTGPHENFVRSDTGPHEEVYREQGKEQGTGNREVEQGGAPPPVVRKSPKPKKAPPLKVVSEPTRQQKLFAEFLEVRDFRCRAIGIDPTPPDDDYGAPWLNAVFDAWLKAFEGASELAPATAEGWTGPETRVLFLFDDYLALSWPAKCQRRVKGKDTGEPQPYPFRALASEKVWKPLVEKLLEGAA